MTLQRDGAGTGRYVPPANTSYNPDVFGLAAPGQLAPYQDAIGPADFEVFDLSEDQRRKYPSGIGLRLTFYDWRGGLNRQKGPFMKDHARLASSSLDTRDKDVVLPQLTESQTTPNAPSFLFFQPYMRAINIFDTLAMGFSSTGVGKANLVRETSLTDPTLIDTGYSSAVLSLSPIVTSNAEGLVIGRPSAAAQIASDLGSPPTIVGSMHASTSGLYGVVQVPIDDAGGAGTNLMLINGTIYSLAMSSTYATAPTQVREVPNGSGGFPIGLVGLGGGYLRVFWGLPALSFGSLEFRFRVYSTNMYGLDLQELEQPLGDLRWAAKLRGGLVMSNGDQVYWIGGISGRIRQNLFWNVDPTPNSDRTRLAANCYIRGDDLYVEVLEYGGGSDSTWWLEKFDWDLRAWHQVSETVDLNDTDVVATHCPPSGAVSQQTGYLHTRVQDFSANGKWYRQYQPEYGVNPNSLRQTPGAGASTGRKFASSGSAQTPYMLLPAPFTYMPKICTAIGLGGDVDAGGSGANVRIDVNGTFADFPYGYGLSYQWYDVPRNPEDRFAFPRITATVTRGSSEYMTPQVLPIVVEMIAFPKDRAELRVIS